MKQYKNLIIAALGSIILASCNKKIEDLQNNPNKPTSVTPNLVLGTVLTDISGTGSAGSLGGTNSWDAVQRWNQYFCRNYQYYGDNQYSWQSGPFDGFLVLKNVVQMESEALKRGAAKVNVYEAIGRFVKAYYFYNMTSLMGDVPLTDALSGTNQLSPSYTLQKQVFQYILNSLDSANNDFASLINSGDNTINGSAQDIYYGGNLTKWQKLVNSFRLRVLISLSKKTSDADLNVAQGFANIYNNPAKYPVFQSQSDDLQFAYIPTYDVYPTSPNNFGSDAQRYNMAQTYVQSLTSLKDARVFVTCEPAWNIVATQGYSPTDFNSFVGAPTGQSVATMYGNAIAGNISFINRKRYYSTYTGEPQVIAGYKELCFNVAEAINRGWISGNAEAWYKTGITESMKFYGLDPSQTNFNAYFLKSGGLSSIAAYPFTFDFNAYYNQSSVKYAGGTTGLNQILLQKYLVFFQNSGWEAYFNYRRTGVPAFSGGTGVGNNGVIPNRWAYPSNEQSLNSANWNAALKNQGFTTDDINGSIWMVK